MKVKDTFAVMVAPHPCLAAQMDRGHRPHQRDLDRDLSDPFSGQFDDPFLAGTLGHDEVLQEFFF